MDKLTRAHEDYLEAIAMLGGSTEQSVRSVDIAAQLKVSKASVSKTLTALREKGLIDQAHYGAVTFTEEGMAYGQAVLERHHLLFRFLTEVLDIPAERADEEACLMEHAISNASFEKWMVFLKNIER